MFAQATTVTSLARAPAREQFIARRGINLEISNFNADLFPGLEMLMKVECDALQKYAGQSTRDFPAGLKRAPSRQSQLVSNPHPSGGGGITISANPVVTTTRSAALWNLGRRIVKRLTAFPVVEISAPQSTSPHLVNLHTTVSGHAAGPARRSHRHSSRGGGPPRSSRSRHREQSRRCCRRRPPGRPSRRLARERRRGSG